MKGSGIRERGRRSPIALLAVVALASIAFSVLLGAAAAGNASRVLPSSGASSTSSGVSSSSDVSSSNVSSSNASSSDASSSDASATPLATHGALHVDGTHIVDEHGDIFQIRGISTHGLAWFPQYVNEDSFATWESWGANTVRLALYTADSGGYCVSDAAAQSALLETLYKGIDAATDLGMYVIVDWHILSDGDPTQNQVQAETFFADISAKYADYQNILYEICNEPNGSATWAGIKSYAADIIPIIRANAPDSVIIVGTTTWSQDVDQAAADPLTFENVVYTLHFYAATHKDDLRAKAQAAVDAGLPLLVSEFGACEASGNGGVDTDSADAWISLLDKDGIGFVCWNLSNKDEASSLLLPTCTATSGWTAADLSAEGQWYRSVLLAHAGLADTSPASSAATSTHASSATSAADASATGASTTGASTTGASTASTTTVSTKTAGGIVATCTRTGGWESGGKQYAQYSLVVSNTGKATVTGWKATIRFADAVEISDGWCATFKTSGTTLTVDPADYAASIDVGGSQESIGFIVESSGEPELSGITVR